MAMELRAIMTTNSGFEGRGTIKAGSKTKNPELFRVKCG
jgi:hypothetical protein